MHKAVYELDADGYLQEIYVAGFDDRTGDPVEPLPERYTLVAPPSGLYKARWDGSAWAETLTREEIDELSNRPREPCCEERISSAESVLLMLMDF